MLLRLGMNLLTDKLHEINLQLLLAFIQFMNICFLGLKAFYFVNKGFYTLLACNIFEEYLRRKLRYSDICKLIRCFIELQCLYAYWKTRVAVNSNFVSYFNICCTSFIFIQCVCICHKAKHEKKTFEVNPWLFLANFLCVTLTIFSCLLQTHHFQDLQAFDNSDRTFQPARFQTA